MRTAICAMVLAAACGGGGSKSSTTPAPGPTCAAVADAMVAMMMEGKEQTEAAAATAGDFETIIRTRCDEDAWTAEAKQCLATMQTRTDAERCSTLLTAEQQENLVRDQKAKFGAGPATEKGESAPEPEPEPATGAAPPPPPAPGSPPPTPLKSSPPKTRRTGDPCDGGE